MRVGELSRRAGVPIPTIKYYLRTGLLSPGSLSSPNQAAYDATHLHELRLVRALIELGKMPVARVRAVLDALAADATPHTVLRAFRGDDAGHEPAARDPDREWAQGVVSGLAARRGWRIPPDHPEARRLASAVMASKRLGHAELVAALDCYAEASEQVARADSRYIAQGTDPHDRAERAVMAALLGDAMHASLRRLAQEEASRPTDAVPGTRAPCG
ncbi:MerR family transcriptional regulator [Streptomyces sp. SYSU K217416]